MSAMTRQRPKPRCITCGCTESHACLVSYGGDTQGCAWVIVDRSKGEGLCSACATVEQLVFALLTSARTRKGITAAAIADYLNRPASRIRLALRRLQHVGLACRSDQLGWREYWHRTEAPR